MRNNFSIIYLGLGSNLNNPKQQIREACNCLHNMDWVRCFTCSALYLSKPIGPQDQPSFINAVARFNTHLAPETLLEQLQMIEKKHHRVKNRHWGERTLDLDILLYGNLCYRSETLTIPHNELLNRDFTLYPLLELAPNLRLPDGRLLKNIPIPKNQLIRINEATTPDDLQKKFRALP